MKSILMSAILLSCLVFSALAVPQRQGFIQVAGPNLRARMDAALLQGRAGNGRFWTAWQFEVRPGVAVDYEWQGRGSSVSVSDGTSISFDRNVETRNLGVFALHENNAVVRLEVYNLDRQREYSGYPVYWLGRASNDESLTFLKGLAEAQNDAKTGERAVMAIALHDDQRIGGMLRQFVHDSKARRGRSSAVFWLGQIGGEQQFLSDLARNEQEETEVRKQAVFAIGVSKDSSALAALQNLYQSVTAREVKKQIVFAASINENQNDAVTWLISLATSERDSDVKKQAIFWLGQKAGERSLKFLGDTANSSDADTEVQKQAVFAISQRPKDEAVPLLISIARTHAKAAVRKQAIFWLGQSGDERAVAFFKELLSQ
ncbi:MAG TPA: HEAT repeat domain-containing protein [Blastocatellia bacterium]|nr:HEAT repeat domain-containing protein [Blastocatellia bacterium]